MLHTVKEERNILHTTKQRKANCIGHVLFRNGLHKHFIEVHERKDRRDGKNWKESEQLLVDRKETIRCWKLKEAALDCKAWKTRSERGYGRVARQTS